MVIKDLVDEDFVQYKKPSMFIIFPYCDFKCDREAGCSICQNSRLVHEPNIDISIDSIIERYISNPMSNAIVCGGLEPFDSWNDLYQLVTDFRNNNIKDVIVIYTGYTAEEINDRGYIGELKKYPNIIIKFGRFIPNQPHCYDELLGVELTSSNQYSIRIS